MLEKVTDRIYYMSHSDETDRPALGIIVGDKCCMVIDAGNSPRHAKDFLKEIKEMGFPEVKYLVITHHHWDHVFGINEWEAVSIASQKTYEYMKTYCNLKYDDISLEEAKMNHIFKDFSINCLKQEIEHMDALKLNNFDISYCGEMTIDLGNVTCIIREIPSPHTEDSTIVYVPEEKSLFLGDCVYGYNSQGFNYYDRELMEQVIRLIEAYDAEHYLCSHESICSRDEMISYFNQLRMGAEMTKGCNNLEKSIAKYKNAYQSEPNDEDLYFIKSFGTGEGWGRSGDMKQEIF